MDAIQHFILDCFDIIHNSPSHIYHSALPLSPSLSWFWKYYNSELSREAEVVTGLSATWGTCFHTVSFQCPATGLACRGSIIVVGLETGKIIILDTVTGTHVSVLSGHTHWVRSLIFSSDGTLLVSGSSDNTIEPSLATPMMFFLFPFHQTALQLFQDLMTRQSGCGMLGQGSVIAS